MEKKKKVIITIVTVILTLVVLLMIFKPGLIKRLTGEVSGANTNGETEVISNEFINEVCNISIDNENFMTIEGKIIMDEGKEGVATVNVVSGDLVFTKEVTVKSNAYTSFTYVLPRGDYDLRIEKEGYKTYETKVSDSKNLNITLVASGNKDIIASSKTVFNTYYDYYSDGTLHLKTVGNFNPEGEEIDPNFFYSVLADVLIKKLSNNGYDIKPVSQGGQYDELVLLIVSIVYSNLVGGVEVEEGLSYRSHLIEAQTKINNGQCTKDNYLEDDNCEIVETVISLFSYNGDISFDDGKEIIGLILEIPQPTKLIIDDSVMALPILSSISSDEVVIGKNVMFAMDYCFNSAKIGTLTINSPYFSNFSNFAGVSKINNLIIGKGITSIPDDGFREASINNISFPSTLEEIGNRAFEEAKIDGVALPDSVKKIGNYAFSGCGLKEVKLPKKLEYIGDSAFVNNSLTSVSLPKTITSLGLAAFSNNDLVDVYWDTNAYANSIFSGNRAESVKLTIGPNVTVVKDIFNGLKLTELNLSYGIKEIGSYAFNNYSSYMLENVAIPSSVEKIGDSAFSNNKITSITIPNSVTYLGSNAFRSNYLESIYFNAINIKTMGGSVFSGNKSSGCTLIIAEGIKTIPAYAFSQASLTKITIPSSVTSIGNNAFSSNTKINEIIIKGDQTRFNSNWTNIGFPASLKPSE